MSVMMENVIGSITAILKNLECAICLELLKTPVSTGCGHFFCRFCITEVLKSNYRTPCPLCKRSFTRRSIQDASQRQSVIIAAKKLAEACGTFTGVNFFSKENSQKELVDNNSLSSLPSTKNDVAVPQESYKTSSKKRKSNENDCRGVIPETGLPVGKTNTKSTKCVDNYIEDSHCVSSNDEIIPSTNKRPCQSHPDSDDDLYELPSLMDLLKTSNVTNTVPSTIDNQQHMNSEKDFNSKQNPIVLAKRVTESEISRECSGVATVKKQMTNQPTDIMPNATSISISEENSERSKERKHQTVPALSENDSSNILKVKRKMSVNVRGTKLNSKTTNKTKKIALRNKTNLGDNLVGEKSISSKVLGDNKTALKIDEIIFNAKEIVKENEITDFELFLSPVKSAVKKSDLPNVSKSPITLKERRFSRKRSRKIKDKSDIQTSSSSAEEETLISKLKEAEDFPLVVSKNTISSTNIVNVNSNEKECYSLKETNLPQIDDIHEDMDVEVATKLAEQPLKADEIADTAVSVQTVASPEVTKLDLLSKSPGWSRVKQVGKDFRVKNFSPLLVEKNSSNTCSIEAIAMDLDSVIGNVPSNELIVEAKFMKTSDNIRVGEVHSEDIQRNNDFHKEDNEICALKAGEKGFEVAPSKECNESNCNVSVDDAAVMINKNVIMDNIECTINKVNDIVKDTLNSVSTTDSLSHHVNLNHDDIEGQSPCLSRDKISSCKAKKTADESLFTSIDVPTSNLRSTNKINDGSKIVSAFTTEYSVKDVNNDLRASLKVKDISVTNSCQTIHQQSDLQYSPESYDFTNSPQNSQPNVFNVGANYEIGSMDVDEMDAKEMDRNTSSFDQNEYFVEEKINSFQHNHPKNLLINRNFNNMQGAELPELVREGGLLSNYKMAANKSVVNQDGNVYYTEHSQQTSQRLLEFCDNNMQHKALLTSVSLHSATNLPDALIAHNEVLEKSDSLFNQVEKFHKKLNLTNAEKTKVLKKTCLTLEEIQEAFVNSSESGKAETICSLPFLSGDFRLHVCVAEETLNISVHKVVKSDTHNGVQSKSKTLRLFEKNVQTSNYNTPIPSPTTVLPSSNTESESSQPDNWASDHNLGNSDNKFPYLSKYSSDSEFNEQVASGLDGMPLNESEIFPFVKTVNVSSANQMRKDKPMKAVNLDIINECVSPAISGKESYLNISNDLPVTQPYHKADKSNNIEPQIEESFHEILVEKVPISSTTDEKDENNDEEMEVVSKNAVLLNNVISEKAMSKSISPSPKKSNSIVTVISPEENDDSPDIISIFKSKSFGSSYPEITDDLDEFSSDPDMAFAMNLVAPLKNIAKQMKSSGNTEKITQHSSAMEYVPSPNLSCSSNKKQAIQTFEDLVLTKSKDTLPNSSLTQRSSRLSLKLKRNHKKFKRIKNHDSDDDSDSSETLKNVPSKGENSSVSNSLTVSPECSKTSSLLKNSSPKESPKDISAKAIKQKIGDVPNESLPDQSTLNSFLSEDMTNVNSSETDMEIEDIELKILSVVEKLKECEPISSKLPKMSNAEEEKFLMCSREDLLKQNKKIPNDSCVKDLVNSVDSDTDCESSDGSEDSTDIFSQSIPPTPPDAVTCNNDPVFKAKLFNNK